MASLRTKDELIFNAYLNGWSRRDSAKIFNVSERQIRRVTSTASTQEREQHASANKDRQGKLVTALKGWKIQYLNINDKKPSQNDISETRKNFRGQAVNGARASYGASKQYKRGKTTSFTAFIESGE